MTGRSLATLLLASSAVAGTLSCRENGSPSPASSGSVAPDASARAMEPRGPKDKPLANERVEIPGGAWFAGSVPGDAGRNPEMEPARFRVELGPYQIDRLPYPNDPERPPLTNVSRDDARRLCAERGARLCTELEWERACKGPDSQEYASGPRWDERCAKDPLRCASAFDVLGLGMALREWTASDLLEPRTDTAPKAIVRGSTPGASATEHRCASRRAHEAGAKASDLGFRCCTGAPNAAVVPEPKLGVTCEKTRITAARLEQLQRDDPLTTRLGKDVRFFKEPDSAETVLARGPGDRKGFSFTVAPLLWNPAAGVRFLLVSARSGERTSFVVAYHVLGEDTYSLAGSFVMEDEPGPVAFAFDGFLRPRLHFSTCWGCSGETGKILFRKPERAAIVQP